MFKYKGCIAFGCFDEVFACFYNNKISFYYSPESGYIYFNKRADCLDEYTTVEESIYF